MYLLPLSSKFTFDCCPAKMMYPGPLHFLSPLERHDALTGEDSGVAVKGVDSQGSLGAPQHRGASPAQGPQCRNSPSAHLAWYMEARSTQQTAACPSPLSGFVAEKPHRDTSHGQLFLTTTEGTLPPSSISVNRQKLACHPVSPGSQL